MEIEQNQLSEILSRLRQLENFSAWHEHNGVDARKTKGQRAMGTFTKNMADASATQKIGHGLSAPPRYVRITAYYDGGGTGSFSSVGLYDADANAMAVIEHYPGVASGNATSNIVVLVPAVGGNTQNATITVDDYNINLAWTKSGSPTGIAYLLWEAYF